LFLLLCWIKSNRSFDSVELHRVNTGARRWRQNPPVGVVVEPGAPATEEDSDNNDAGNQDEASDDQASDSSIRQSLSGRARG